MSRAGSLPWPENCLGPRLWALPPGKQRKLGGGRRSSLGLCAPQGVVRRPSTWSGCVLYLSIRNEPEVLEWVLGVTSGHCGQTEVIKRRLILAFRTPGKVDHRITYCGSFLLFPFPLHFIFGRPFVPFALINKSYN